jgi:hypothetical protein
MRQLLLGGGMYARAFPTGTLMVFQQTAAPTGWTKQTSHDDKSLRVVTGTASSGGATAFSSVFGSSKTTGSHAVTTDEMPSHAHVEQYFSGGSGGTTLPATASTSDTATTAVVSTAATGGGSGHTHTLSLDINFVDVIIAAKL